MDEFEDWLTSWFERRLTYSNFMRATDEELAAMLVKDMKDSKLKVIREQDNG